MKKYKICFHIFCHFFWKIFVNKNAIKRTIFGKNLGGQEIFFFKLHFEASEIFSLLKESVNFAFFLIFCFLCSKNKGLQQKMLELLLKSYKTPLFGWKWNKYLSHILLKITYFTTYFANFYHIFMTYFGQNYHIFFRALFITIT